MSGWADLGPGARSALIVGIVALAATAGVRFGLGGREDPGAGTAAIEVAPDAAGTVAGGEQAPAETAGEDAASAADEEGAPAAPVEGAVAEGAGADPRPEPVDESPAEAPEAAEAPVPPPAFDIVRVAPDGATLVAGRAAPGEAVEVMLDGAPIFTAMADGNGRFAAMFSLSPSETPRLMSLRVAGRETGESVQSVVLAPLAPLAADAAGAGTAAEVPAATGPAVPGEEAIAEAAPAGAGPEPVIAAPAPAGAAAGEEETPGEAVAAPAADAPPPVLLLADDKGARLLQPPEAEAEARPGLVIDTISTDTGGQMSVAGRAQGTGFARLYADNVEVATVEIDEGGWRAPLPDSAPDRYALRVDQLDATGAVVARTETEVTRETREDLEGLLVEEVRAGTAGAVVVTVERGFTLWAIARENYGDGRLYVKVFEANRSQIRDPDLIYPGQVFSVPIETTEPG